VIDAHVLTEKLGAIGFEVFSGLPCSYLTPLINTVIADPEIDYVGVTNEGDAVAVACGAALGGKLGVVLFQNSGLGNAVSPLTSLTATFGIPLLVLVTWRGQPGGATDEPQHGLMGSITPQLLELMDIPWDTLPSEESGLDEVLQRVAASMRERRPHALIVEKGTIAGDASPGHRASSAERAPYPSASGAIADPFEQDDVLRAVQSGVGDREAILATTGFTGRALCALDDRPNQLYMVGSMGCVSSLGLGLAKAQPERRVVVLDGDGALLMRMGALAILGYERPPNLLHIVLDNGVHDSTGAQATVSPSVDVPALAHACGYPQVRSVASLAEFEEVLRGEQQELTLLHVRTSPRADRKLPRPELTPQQVGERFRTWLTG
jgi:phosphonopyruvate decarboxylase